jgi:menaquinone-9 beta-reductase
MLEHTHYDVLVVGARCAGASAAMLMARQGLRVLAVDRGAYGSDTVSTHALMRGGVLLLNRWGLTSRLRAGGTPAIRHTTFHYGETATRLDIRPAQGVDALFAPRRTLLDRVLADAAMEAGAELRYGHRLTALLRRPDGRVAGAHIRDENGLEAEVTADFVVGADGIGSTVARLVNAPMLKEARHASAILYGHWSGLQEDGYCWYYRPDASAGVIPTNQGMHCVFAALPPARFRTEVRQDAAGAYSRALKAASPVLHDTTSSGRLAAPVSVFAGRRGFLRQAYGPGWALIGDAGYFKDPLTAHGMTDALRDAELLAQAVSYGTDAALAEFALTRDRLSLPLFEVSDDIASFHWDLETVQQHHQALNRAMKTEVEHLAALGAPQPARAFYQEYAA